VPVFHYKAVDADGEVQEGDMEAADVQAVIERLQSSGHIPIRAEEVRAGKAAGGRFRLPELRRRGVSQRQVGIFTQELATLLRAGLPLDRALEILLDLAEDEQMAGMIARMQEAVRGGKSLSEALEAQQRVFSRFYVNMVRAGEAGGALDVVLGRLADYLTRSKELRDSVLSALIYPAILVSVAGLSVVILLTFVVPQFTQLFEDMGKALPLPTQIVVSLGDLFRAYWWALLLALGGVIWLIQRQLENPNTRYRWDKRLLRLPLFGDLIARLEVARFSRTLGTLLGNGVPLLTALSIVKETLSNRVLATGIEPVADQLKEGQGLAGPLMEAQLFPPLAVHMIKVGEETGHLEEMLLQVADIYDREVQTAVKRLLALLEPILILGLAVIIAAIIISILMAILSVNELAF
jgi:general secretion pathway protein F